MTCDFPVQEKGIRGVGYGGTKERCMDGQRRERLREVGKQNENGTTMGTL
jgi:hypothetical protein